MDNKKLKDLAVRTASGAVMLLIFVGAVLWSRWSALALFAVIMIGGLLEFYKLCRAKGYKPNVVLGIITSVFMFACMSVSFVTENIGDASAIILFLIFSVVLIPLVFVCEMWRKSETPIANVATTFMGVLYVALPMSMLLLLPAMLVRPGAASNWALLAFMSIIWANDVFAYLVGVSIGKHRLCERLSPKKSWEGFIGGLLGAISLAIVFGYLFEGTTAAMVRWGGLGLITAVTGVAGDLIESMMKREVGVKDSGKIMPGHGGFLDRFDALFISVPFVVIYLFLTITIMSII